MYLWWQLCYTATITKESEEIMLKNKPFTVTYYSAKDKKTITRNALWTDQCRYWTSKAGRLIMTYFDVDKNEYRNATDTWSIK